MNLLDILRDESRLLAGWADRLERLARSGRAGPWPLGRVERVARGLAALRGQLRHHAAVREDFLLGDPRLRTPKVRRLLKGFEGEAGALERRLTRLVEGLPAATRASPAGTRRALRLASGALRRHLDREEREVFRRAERRVPSARLAAAARHADEREWAAFRDLGLGD